MISHWSHWHSMFERWGITTLSAGSTHTKKFVSLDFATGFRATWMIHKKSTPTTLQPISEAHLQKSLLTRIGRTGSSCGLEPLEKKPNVSFTFTRQCAWTHRKKTTLPPDISLIIVHMFNEITEVGEGGIKWWTGSTESMDRQNNRIKTKSYTSWTLLGQRNKRKKGKTIDFPTHFSSLLWLKHTFCSFSTCEMTLRKKQKQRKEWVGGGSIKGACSPSPSCRACMRKDWCVETFMRYGRFITLLKGEGNSHDISRPVNVKSNFSSDV